MLCQAFNASPLGINKSPKIGALESIHPAAAGTFCWHLPPWAKPELLPALLLPGQFCFPKLAFSTSSLPDGRALVGQVWVFLRPPAWTCTRLCHLPWLSQAWWHLRSGAQNCLPVAPPALEAPVYPPCTVRGCVFSRNLRGSQPRQGRGRVGDLSSTKLPLSPCRGPVCPFGQ